MDWVKIWYSPSLKLYLTVSGANTESFVSCCKIDYLSSTKAKQKKKELNAKGYIEVDKANFEYELKNQINR